MGKEIDNEPAFACCDNGMYLQSGLTKREYFAGKALQGLMVQTIEGQHNQNNKHNNTETAIFCVSMADALLKALK